MTHSIPDPFYRLDNNDRTQARAIVARYEGVKPIELTDAEHDEVYANLCDVLMYTIWPDHYGLDVSDPGRRTSNAARLLASVINDAVGLTSPSWRDDEE